MEGSVGSLHWKGTLAFFFVLSLGISLPAVGGAQEGAGGGQAADTARLKLRKTVKTRQYRGRSVEGEERVVSRGDSLWRMLIEEKGLSEKLFHRYLVLVTSLNPQLKDPNLLRVGDIIFIPLRPDEFLGVEVPSGGIGPGKVYRVRRGDFLFKILKQQLGLRGRKEIGKAFSQVKELNPRKKNWNLLFVGEAILLPSMKEGEPPAVTLVPSPGFIGLDHGKKLPIEENLGLLQQVVGIMGNEMSRAGEETVALKEGNVYIDRSLFPVIQNSRSGKKIVLDVEEKISPAFLRQFQERDSDLSVVSVKKGTSLHEAANTLFSKLGLQTLPSELPVVVQDEGVGVQVKGEWVVADPGDSGKEQKVWIISLTDTKGKTPDYLRDYLSLKGMNLKEVLIPSPPSALTGPSPGSQLQEATRRIETWPRDKKALVDAFLQSYGIAAPRAHVISLSLGKGMRLDTRIDRLFEVGGRKYGVLFHTIGDEIKRALKESENLTPIVIELEALSSRQILSRLVAALGEGGAYGEHRFPMARAGAKDKLVLTVPGFYLPKRSLLLTDRTIPRDLQRFFFERGLRVIYF